MAKHLLTTVELVKRVYLIEADSKTEAYDKLFEMGPDGAVKTEVLGDHILHEDMINEYEYNRTWKPQPDYSEGHDFYLQTKDHEGYQYDWVKDDRHFD